MKNEIAWVVFDLGGIVVPECGDQMIDEMASHLGVSPGQISDIVRKYKRGMTAGKISLLEMYSDVIRELSLPFSPESVLRHHLEFYREAFTRRDSEVIRIIETLKEYFGVACLTNIEKEIACVCRESGLFDYFHKAFLSVDMGMQKPDREIYEEVARSIGCPTEHIAFIDDRAENVQGARDIGMHGFLFHGAELLRTELSALCPSLSDEGS